MIPSLLINEAEVTELVERLEVHYLANNDGDIHFALLTDWTDASHESMPGDEALLKVAADGIAELNRRHGVTRFLLLHRRRLHNPSQHCFMGGSASVARSTSSIGCYGARTILRS